MLTRFPGKLTCRKATQLSNERNYMGDRSPKSNQKKSNQKQEKTNAANQQKRQAISDKQAAGKKK